jgi:hypothetical protein
MGLLCSAKRGVRLPFAAGARRRRGRAALLPFSWSREAWRRCSSLPLRRWVLSRTGEETGRRELWLARATSCPLRELCADAASDRVKTRTLQQWGSSARLRGIQCLPLAAVHVIRRASSAQGALVHRRASSASLRSQKPLWPWESESLRAAPALEASQWRPRSASTTR